MGIRKAQARQLIRIPALMSLQLGFGSGWGTRIVLTMAEGLYLMSETRLWRLGARRHEKIAIKMFWIPQISTLYSG